MRRFSLSLLIGTLVLPLAVSAQEQPSKIYGTDELNTFMQWLPDGATLTPPKLVAPFEQKDKGIIMRYPKDWSVTVSKKTATQLEAFFSPMESLSRVEGTISLRMLKKQSPLEFSFIDKFFDQNTYLSDGASIGDWYLPGLGALNRSDATIAAQPGRQFMYAFNHGEVYIGVERMFIIGSAIYDISMWAPTKYAKDVYPVFDAMSKDLKIGMAQASSARTRAPASVSNKRIPKVKQSSSAMSKVKSSASSVRKASVKSSKKASSMSSSSARSSRMR